MDAKRKTLFLVDDDITNLAIGKKALAGTYNVFTLNSGQVMLDMLQNLTPDLIYPKLMKYGVMDFLNEHYETEHLENIIYVIEDMDNILKQNGGSLE